eukprot:11910293-Alexandrium_andersonii.AAC.1
MWSLQSVRASKGAKQYICICRCRVPLKHAGTQGRSRGQPAKGVLQDPEVRGDGAPAEQVARQGP